MRFSGLGYLVLIGITFFYFLKRKLRCSEMRSSVTSQDFILNSHALKSGVKLILAYITVKSGFISPTAYFYHKTGSLIWQNKKWGKTGWVSHFAPAEKQNGTIFYFYIFVITH